MVVVYWPKGFESHEFCDFVEVDRSVILRPQTVGWNRARAVNVGRRRRTAVASTPTSMLRACGSSGSE